MKTKQIISLPTPLAGNLAVSDVGVLYASGGLMCNRELKVPFAATGRVFINERIRCIKPCVGLPSWYIYGTEKCRVCLCNHVRGLNHVIYEANGPIMSISALLLDERHVICAFSTLDQEMSAVVYDMADENKEETRKIPIYQGKAYTDIIVLVHNMLRFEDTVVIAYGGTRGTMCVTSIRVPDYEQAASIMLHDHQAEISSIQLCQLSSSILVVSTGLDGSTRTYSLETSDGLQYRLIKTYRTHSLGITGSYLSKIADTTRLYTVGLDGAICCFELQDEFFVERRTISVDSQLLNVVVNSNVGVIIASDMNGAVFMFDDLTGLCIPSFTGSISPITQISCTDMGIVASSGDGFLRVFDRMNYCEILRPISHGFPVKTFVYVKPGDNKHGNFICGSEEAMLRTLIPSRLDKVILGSLQTTRDILQIKTRFDEIVAKAFENQTDENVVCYGPNALDLQPRSIYGNYFDVEHIAFPRCLNEHELSYFTLFQQEISSGITSCRTLRLSPAHKLLLGRTILNPRETSYLFLFAVFETIEEEMGDYLADEGPEHKKSPALQVRTLAETPLNVLHTSEQISDVEFMDETHVVASTVNGFLILYAVSADASLVEIGRHRHSVEDGFISYCLCKSNEFLVLAGGDCISTFRLEGDALHAVSCICIRKTVTCVCSECGKVAVGTKEGTSLYFSQTDGRLEWVAESGSHASPVTAVCLCPDGALVSGAQDGSIVVWAI